MSDVPQNSGNFGSFARQSLVVLKESRLWAVVIPFLVLAGVVVLLVGPRVATVVTLAIGLVASYVINRIDKLPALDGLQSVSTLTERVLVPAFAGILIMGGSDILVRIWLMLWFWFHTSTENPSCSYLMVGAAWGWLGVIVCSAVLAALTRTRATYAAIVGVAVYIPLGFTDVFSGTLAEKSASVLASTCKWYDGGAGGIDLDAFREGMASAVIIRALFVIFAARLVSSWLVGRATAASSAKASD